MESFLLNRSLGTIRPSTFERAQTTRLIHALQPAAANAVIFDGSPDTPAHSQLDTLDRSTQERSTTDASNTSDDAVAQPESTDSAPRAPVSLARRRAALASAARSRAGGETVPSLRDDQGGGRRRPVSSTNTSTTTAAPERNPCAHHTSIRALAVDQLEGRLLLSGDQGGGIYLWDLTLETSGDEHAPGRRSRCYRPAAAQPHFPARGGRDSTSMSWHGAAISELSFYPFDNDAFISSSFDCTLNINSTEMMKASASFNLGTSLTTHSVSSIASHLLVACGSLQSNVRLVDMRSGEGTHSLYGHAGHVLSVAWSPRDEHTLASAATDGTARLWDVRSGAGTLAELDMDYSEVMARPMRSSRRTLAHAGIVDGIIWTHRGDHLVTSGGDHQIRVWDAATTCNTLANFGPLINSNPYSWRRTKRPVLAPAAYLPSTKNIMFFPNDTETLVFDLFEGTLLKRLRHASGTLETSPCARKPRPEVATLAWRTGNVEMYSGHTDGTIKAWIPRTREEAERDEEEAAEAQAASLDGGSERKRKGQVLEDVYRDLTRQKITFGLQ